MAPVNVHPPASGNGGRPWASRTGCRPTAAGSRIAAWLAGLAVAVTLAAVPGMPAQAYANGDARIEVGRAAQPHGRAVHVHADHGGPDSTFDITGLLLPMIGVLSLIARRRLTQRQR